MVHARMVSIATGGGGSGGDELEVEGEMQEGSGRGGAISQYFLITPKLLHGLKYERGMRVLCIASGEFMPCPEDQKMVDFRACVDIRRGIEAAG